jgi:hypothetical protein
MTNDSAIDFPKLLAPLFPDSNRWSPRDWDYDADIPIRKAVLSELGRIFESTNSNLLIGYTGHLNNLVGLATQEDVPYATAYKKYDHVRNMSPGFTVDILKASEAQNGEGLRITYIDDCAEHGGAALKLVEALRLNDFAINNAIVLVEAEGKGARGALAKAGVKLHSLVRG